MAPVASASGCCRPGSCPPLLSLLLLLFLSVVSAAEIVISKVLPCQCGQTLGL